MHNTVVNLGRKGWTTAGLILVGLGFIGAIVPGMPTTVFLIMALYCFRRGSIKFENWLLNHKVFGPTLRDWDDYRGMRKKTKTIALTMMWIFIGLSLYILRNRIPIAVIVGSVGVFATWYILSRPTIEEKSPIDSESVNEKSDQAFLG